MFPCQSSRAMADIHENRPTKRGFSSSGDDACYRLVTRANTHANQEEDLQEMAPVKKMRHQSNEATDAVNALFSAQSIDSPGPLGLKLTESASFLELIQKKLTLAAKVKRTQATKNGPYYRAKRTKSTAAKGMKPSQKPQAAKFHASLLRIGDWEWKSRYQGDLVAKIYFVKRKVAWEMLHEGLKRKIEMTFSDICTLRISCPKDLPATLELMVSAAPQFFREGNPRPLKSTTWLHTTDFTGGQAKSLSRHILRCDPGIMDKHIKNLLSRDHRLCLLSQEKSINPQSPFLKTFSSVPEISLSSSDVDNLFGTEQTGEFFPLHLMPKATTTVGLNHSGALQGVLSPSKGILQNCDFLKIFETTDLAQQPSASNGGMMNAKGNHTNNLVNLENSRRRLNYSSPPEVIRSFPGDSEVIRRFPGDSITNQQVEPQSQSRHTDLAVVSQSLEGPSAQQAPLNKDMRNWRNFLQTPQETQPSSVPNAGIMDNDSGNRFNNQMTSQTLPRSANASSLPAEMTAWRTPNYTRTNQQVNLWNQSSYNNGLSIQNMIEQEIPQCEPSGNQTMLPNLSSNGNVSPDRMGLELLTQNLLSDDVVVSAVEEQSLLSTVNVFSCLIEQAPAPSLQNSNLQASNATAAPPAAVEPTEAIDVDATESSGADDWLLAMMESPSSSSELSPEDMAVLLP